MTDPKYMTMVNVLRANGMIKDPRNCVPGTRGPKKPKNGFAATYKPDEEMERLKNMTLEESMKRMMARIQKEQTERMKREKAAAEYRKKHHGRNLK